jgi:nucleoside-diphosphate-sugar epimerase
MGGNIRPVYGALPDRPLEPVRVADRERAFAQIGFRPQVALREGLQRTINWYNTHPAPAAEEKQHV